MIRVEDLRLTWILKYEECKNAGKVCAHYGISRNTLRKWVKRYEKNGKSGLVNLSKKPNISPLQKQNSTNENLIIKLREERKLGARRIQNELKRLHNISFSLSTIHKVLKKYKVNPLKKKRHYRKETKRYNCEIPGERVQMDVCKIANNMYQYTAIDDCTRYKVLNLYKNRNADNTLDFLDKVLERMPFPIQRIQTDRGQEFFAYKVQEYLQLHKIKFRPIKPASPYLNGKVERSQRTDLDEFYNSIDIKDPVLEHKLQKWAFYYNYQRFHSSLNAKTPYEKYKELQKLIPDKQKIIEAYDSSYEPIITQNYKNHMILKSIMQNN